MAKIGSLSESYTITLGGKEVTVDKQCVLNNGIRKLGIGDITFENAFNYETLKKTWKSKTSIPTEAELKSKGIEQMEADLSLPTIDEIKASAKAKLIAGEKLTEQEATIITGV